MADNTTRIPRYQLISLMAAVIVARKESTSDRDVEEAVNLAVRIHQIADRKSSAGELG